MLVTRIAVDADQPLALSVWGSANAARGLVASPQRVRRVEEKLSDASGLLVVIVDDEQVVGMALAEPFKDRDGAGPVMPGAGHISMVFVDPDRWGEGLGGHLLRYLHIEMCDTTWAKASLWTRATNDRARRLYSRRGYELTGDIKRLPNGDEIVRYEALLSQLPQ
jgi:ribosomal protein S18 acetylase RimI-like enzyme